MSCLYGRGKSCGVCHGLESAKRMGIAKLQVQMDDLAVVLALRMMNHMVVYAPISYTDVS